eukprot:gb/GEZN01006155.1/.p1 GENE.gb/GEZN01006155.1/~~gb/GEZN01006155.1/.p1  ORF type:complete len:448 (-),score=67.81 gb/GEZN01006155.1/:329-1672(-)
MPPPETTLQPLNMEPTVNKNSLSEPIVKRNSLSGTPNKRDSRSNSLSATPIRSLKISSTPMKTPVNKRNSLSTPVNLVTPDSPPSPSKREHCPEDDITDNPKSTPPKTMTPLPKTPAKPPQHDTKEEDIEPLKTPVHTTGPSPSKLRGKRQSIIIITPPLDSRADLDQQRALLSAAAMANSQQLDFKIQTPLKADKAKTPLRQVDAPITSTPVKNSPGMVELDASFTTPYKSELSFEDLKTPPSHCQHEPLSPSKHDHIMEDDLEDEPTHTPPSHIPSVPGTPSKHELLSDAEIAMMSLHTPRRASMTDDELFAPSPQQLAVAASNDFVIHSPTKRKTPGSTPRRPRRASTSAQSRLGTMGALQEASEETGPSQLGVSPSKRLKDGNGVSPPSSQGPDRPSTTTTSTSSSSQSRGTPCKGGGNITSSSSNLDPSTTGTTPLKARMMR